MFLSIIKLLHRREICYCYTWDSGEMSCAIKVPNVSSFFCRLWDWSWGVGALIYYTKTEVHEEGVHTTTSNNTTRAECGMRPATAC